MVNKMKQTEVRIALIANSVEIESFFQLSCQTLNLFQEGLFLFNGPVNVAQVDYSRISWIRIKNDLGSWQLIYHY